MSRRIPPEAFQYYVGLGPGRSYQAVADHYAVSKQAVVKLANRENWQTRLEEVEEKARQKVDSKAVEDLEAMNARHLRTLRVIQAKALETLKNSNLNSAIEAVRAMELAITKERLIRGEPSERTAVSVEEATKREFNDWMLQHPQGDEEDDTDGDDSDT